MCVRRVGAVALLVTFTPGCGRQYTELMVRNPRAVSVEIETPHGRETLLAAGGPAQEVNLPRTTPPYGNTALFASSVVRDESGGIALRCDACTGVPAIRVVPAPGTFQIPGNSASVVEKRGSENHIHVDYPYYVPGGEHGYLTGPYTAFRVDLVTTAGNVTDVRGGYTPVPARDVGIVMGLTVLLLLGIVAGVRAEEHRP